MLDKDIGAVPCQNIPEDAAADPGNNPQGNGKEEVFTVSGTLDGIDADSGKDAEPEGICQKDDAVKVVFLQKMGGSDRRNKRDDGGDRGGRRIDRPRKQNGRHFSQKEIPENPAATGCYDAHNAHAQHIHLFLDGGNGTGNRKGNRADDFKNKNEEHV